MIVAGLSFSSRAAAFKRQIDRHFATKAARFRLAVSSGFVLVAVGFLVVGVNARVGVAQLFWGGMTFGGSPGPQAYQAPSEPSPQYAAPRKHRAHLARNDRDNLVKHARYDGEKPVALVRRSMCVRLCDGFVFPIGDYHGDSDRAAHEATCQSECPGAKTALYVVPQGSDSISDANEVSSGRNYSELPGAFHYTTYLDETCSCHPHGGNRIKSLLHDFTLRRGDAVMTNKGLQVFHGGGSYPYKRRDFVALAKSRDIRKSDRESLRAIERASLIIPTTVASTALPPKVSDARRDSTKELVHQANN